MLDQYTASFANRDQCLSSVDTQQCLDTLQSDGYCVLRGYRAGLDQFSALINRLCTEVTFDPARAISADSVQKVDAGVAAIGLHIENGNTPLVPHLLGFYCRQAARHGSQTTLCDGQTLWAEMPADMKTLFAGTLTVTRTLSEWQWKRYLAQEHPALQSADQVTIAHLQQMLAMYPNHDASVNDDGSIEYRLTTQAVRTSKLTGMNSFANTLLGPSFNYEPPRFYFDNGQLVSAELIERLGEFCERYTVELNWQKEDVVLIDNWRVMHGRRAIVDAENRELFIGMGMIQ